MNNFYTKYEEHHIKGAKNTDKTTLNTKPKDVKQKMDEIAKRRAELKKLTKKQEIDAKLTNSVIKKVEEDEVPGVPTPNEDTDNINQSVDPDKNCVICYKSANLYVAKCGHYA